MNAGPGEDAVTGLSGSGPGYVFAIINALIDGGVKVGLSRPIATTLAMHTVYGAAKMMIETGEHPVKLRDIYSSRGIPRILRGMLPVIRSGDLPLWVPGVARARNTCVPESAAASGNHIHLRYDGGIAWIR